MLALTIGKMPLGSLKENKLHIDLKKASVYNNYAQMFAVFGYPGMIPDTDLFTAVYERFAAELDFLKDKISLCRSKKEADKAFSEGKTAAFLSVEGAEVLDCSTERLEDAYLKGVRSLCLTWNRPTELTGTNTSDTDRGLSQKGRDYVRLAEELGIILDVSHISDAGFWDLARMAKKPFIASHSNSRAVFNHSRNLTDDMFKAVRDIGGTAGLNLYSDFLGAGEVNIETAVRHIEHFLELGGEKTVAVGGDLDGCEKLPAGVDSLSDLPLIYEALAERGYDKQLLDDIFMNNLMRLFA
jgi:membrane dipeptidase